MSYRLAALMTFLVLFAFAYGVEAQVQQRDESSEIAFTFIVVVGSLLAGGYFLLLRHNHNLVSTFRVSTDDPDTRLLESEDISSITSDSITLISLGTRNHSGALTTLMDHLISGGMGGVYVSISAPSELVVQELTEKGISLDDVMFIDCVQKTYDSKQASAANTVYVENPSFLEEIVMQVSRTRSKVSSAQKFLVIDSLSSLLVHNTSESVGEFAQRMINNTRMAGDAGVFLVVDKKETQCIIQSVLPSCDGLVIWDQVRVRDPKDIVEASEPLHRYDPEAAIGTHQVAIGRSYLVLEEPGASKAMNLFFNLSRSRGYRNLCISRDSPKNIASEFDIEGVKLIWLTDTADGRDDTVASRPLDLSIIMDDFTRGHEDSLIILDGLQYIINEYDFKSVLKLVATLKDRMAQTNSILLIPVIASSLDPLQLGLLESELDII